MESFLLDEGVERKPVRVQVGWDSNDYQIYIGTVDGRTEYKRMLARDGSLGITHAIFAPLNSLRSSRDNATDVWGWEETLWFTMGEALRTRQWLPKAGGKLPAGVEETVSSARAHNVSLLAYACAAPFIHFPRWPCRVRVSARLRGHGELR